MTDHPRIVQKNYGFTEELIKRYNADLERLLTDAITVLKGPGWELKDLAGCLNARYSKEGKVSFFLNEACLVRDFPPPSDYFDIKFKQQEDNS